MPYARLTVGHQLPVCVGGGGIPQRHPLPRHPSATDKVGDSCLKLSCPESGIAVYRCTIRAQPYINAERVEKMFFMRHIDGQAVERWLHTHLESKRIKSFQACTLLRGETLRLVLRRSACNDKHRRQERQKYAVYFHHESCFIKKRQPDAVKHESPLLIVINVRY